MLPVGSLLANWARPLGRGIRFSAFVAGSEERMNSRSDQVLNRCLLVPLVLFLALPACSAQGEGGDAVRSKPGVVTVRNAPELLRVLGTAERRSKVLLAPGNYGQVWIVGVQAQGVVVASQEAARPAVIEFLNLRDSAGLTFSGIEIGMEAGGGQGVRVTNSSDIRLERLDVHGVLDGDPSYDGTGVLVENSSRISIVDSRFHDVTSGIGHKNTNGLTISNNDFRLLRADGVAGNDSNDVTISGNHFTNFFPLKGDHADVIQFWQVAQAVTRNITVTDNVFVRGDGEKVQGIFMTASTLGYEKMVITGNAIVGGMYHGITVDKVTHLEISDNFVQAYNDLTSWILVQNSHDVHVTNNQATDIAFKGSEKAQQQGNRVIGKAKVGDTQHLRRWEQDRPKRAARR